MELEVSAFEALTRAGIKRGQIVLDFGCGSGAYAISAAKIVGNEGKVYALDKDKKALDELMQKAESARLKNLKRIDTHGELKIDLADNSVDTILFFDVLHSHYFPQADGRRKLFEEVCRISKAGARILVYPHHMEPEVKDELINDIENTNFYLSSEYLETLVHANKELKKGQVLIFRKKLMVS